MFKQHKFNGKVKANYLPVVYLSEDAYHDMACLVRFCDDEIGWLATAYQWDTGDYFLDKVFLFEQEVNLTTTEITPEGLAEWASEMMDKDEDEFLKIYEHIRCWGHSHVRMDTGPSAQDDNQMEIWENDCDFFVRVICNKHGKMSFDIFDYVNGIIYTDCEWAIYIPDAERNRRNEHWKSQIEDKVSKKTYTYYSGSLPNKKSYSDFAKSGATLHSLRKNIKGSTQSNDLELIDDDDDDDNYYEVVRGHYDWGDNDNWDLSDYEEYFKERKLSGGKVSDK